MEQQKKDALEMGHRLLVLRTMLKLSQRELADIIGVNHRHVSEWENGKKMISIKFLVNMCRAFNISLAYFDPGTQDYCSNIPRLVNDSPFGMPVK